MNKREASTGNGARSLKYICIVVLVFSAAIFSAISYLSNHCMFEVKIHDSGDIVFNKVIGSSSAVALRYIHSVTKQPVTEIFRVRNNNLLALEEMRYDSFGANLPVGPETTQTETTQFNVKEGYYQILYADRIFESVPLRVGRVIADHTLRFEDGASIHLLDHVQGGEYVEFCVRPLIDF